MYHILNSLYTIVAPGTGTPETGGWSTRELRTIIRGLDGLNFIGADIVEVAPAYDTNAELSTMYVFSNMIGQTPTDTFSAGLLPMFSMRCSPLW